VDDTIVIITQPFNEVVWAAGTAIGNKTSYHFEQAWGGDVDFNQSVEVAAALHGGLIAARGWGMDALVQHHYWYGKNCPGQIRAKGLWPSVVRKVQAYATAARAAAGGGGTMYPEHMTEAVAKSLFGSYKASDGRTYAFDPSGPVSQAWLEYGKAKDLFPRLEDVNIGSQGQKFFIFRNGMILYQAAGSGVIELVGA
jgi:hypothetical protein